MARRPIEIGPTGQVVAANIARFRGLRGYTLADLSERTRQTGRPMSGTTISAIENRTRRADIDDLVSLCAALGISPASMMMDTQPDGYEPAAATVNDHGVTMAGTLWSWLTAEAPLDGPEVITTERDEIDIESWRREQVPPWAHRRREVGGDG